MSFPFRYEILNQLVRFCKKRKKKKSFAGALIGIVAFIF
jgi:hypothetical protein